MWRGRGQAMLLAGLSTTSEAVSAPSTRAGSGGAALRGAPCPSTSRDVPAEPRTLACTRGALRTSGVRAHPAVRRRPAAARRCRPRAQAAYRTCTVLHRATTSRPWRPQRLHRRACGAHRLPPPSRPHRHRRLRSGGGGPVWTVSRATRPVRTHVQPATAKRSATPRSSWGTAHWPGQPTQCPAQLPPPRQSR